MERKRFESLDAFRGIAILGMVLSGTIALKILPAWMYHAQVPPPNHEYDPKIPGLTWVDLVFPFFLFAMGAAIPLALNRRLAAGISKLNMSLSVAKRFILMTFFAVVVEHLRPFQLNENPSAKIWFLAILGFVALGCAFGSWRKFTKNQETGANIVGALFIAATLFLQPYDGHGFSMARNDIILLILANSFLFTALTWIFSRENEFARWVVVAFVFAFHLSAAVPGWASTVLIYPLPTGLVKVEFLEYLLITLPGTVLGDMLVCWSTSSNSSSQQKLVWESQPLVPWTLIAHTLAWMIFLLITVQGRWMILSTAGSFVFAGSGIFLLRNSHHQTQIFVKKVFLMGGTLVLLGLFLDAFQGGVHKDPVTLSYCFLTAGMSFLTFIACFLLFDVLRKGNMLKLLMASGQNPMVAYVAFQNLI